MKIIKYILSLLFFSPTLLFAQTEGVWSLKHSTEDKNKTSKAALFQYTKPDESSSSKSIDAALGYTWLPANSDVEYTFAVEGHKNTLTDKEQDTLSIKGLYSDIFYEGDCLGDICTNILYGSFSLGYQVDEIKDDKSILLINEWHGIYKDLYIGVKYDKSKWFEAYWTPSLGLEYENVVDSEEGNKGDVLRFYKGFSVSLTPLPEINDKLTFSYTYSHWNDLAKDDGLNIQNNTHQYRNIEIRWNLIKEDKGFEVYLSYQLFDGENPREDKQKQKYEQIGLNIGYNL